MSILQLFALDSRYLNYISCYLHLIGMEIFALAAATTQLLSLGRRAFSPLTAQALVHKRFADQC